MSRSVDTLLLRFARSGAVRILGGLCGSSVAELAGSSGPVAYALPGPGQEIGMLGFAIVDRHSTATATAVWLTTHAGGTAVQHTNAVVIEQADDEYEKKIRALTADRVVVLTPGSDAGGLFRASLDLKAFSEMTAETAARQQLIADAIASYAAETKNRNLVFPEYLEAPHPPIESSVEPQFRALAVANYVAGIWSRWLATEEQRLRRTTDPRTGKPPWIMPEGLAHPALALLPPGFSAAVVPEPLSKRAGFS